MAKYNQEVSVRILKLTSLLRNVQGTALAVLPEITDFEYKKDSGAFSVYKSNKTSQCLYWIKSQISHLAG